MATALDADPSRFDEHERNFVAKIREHGWFQTSVAGDEVGPSFCYTTGFWATVKFPDLITFSTRSDIAHDAFWYMYKELKDGRTFPVREPTKLIFENVPAVLLEVHEKHFPEYLGWSCWFYGRDGCKCLRLVWPDLDGKFPWDFAMAEQFLDHQPDLTDGNWSGLRRH